MKYSVRRLGRTLIIISLTIFSLTSYAMIPAELVEESKSSDQLLCTVSVGEKSEDILFSNSSDLLQPALFHLALGELEGARKLSLSLMNRPDLHALEVKLFQRTAQDASQKTSEVVSDEPFHTSLIYEDAYGKYFSKLNYSRKKRGTVWKLFEAYREKIDNFQQTLSLRESLTFSNPTSDADFLFRHTYFFNEYASLTRSIQKARPSFFSPITLHCRGLSPTQKSKYIASPLVTAELSRMIDQPESFSQEDFIQDGRTPLHWAARINNAKLIRELIQKNSDPRAVNFSDAKGNTPLHFASLLGNEAAEKALLKNGANAKILNVAGFSPNDLKLLGLGQTQAPTHVPFYNLESATIDWIQHSKAVQKLGFFFTENGVANRGYYFNEMLNLVPRVSPDLASSRYSSAALFFAPSPVGMGVHTYYTIEKGDFIGGYLGLRSGYRGSFFKRSKYKVSSYNDFEKVGGILSRVNTPSCPAGANVRLANVRLNGYETHGLVATRKILPGEEILWFYGHPAYVRSCMSGDPIKLEDRPRLRVLDDPLY